MATKPKYTAEISGLLSYTNSLFQTAIADPTLTSAKAKTLATAGGSLIADLHQVMVSVSTSNEGYEEGNFSRTEANGLAEAKQSLRVLRALGRADD